MSTAETNYEMIEFDAEVITSTSNVMPLPSNVTKLPVTTSPVSPLDLPTEVFQEALNRRRANRSFLLQWIRQSLVDGIDYGSIETKRGLSKPSLRKSGAEKLKGLLNVTVHFPSLKETEQAILQGHTPEYLMVRCELRAQGRVIAEGTGARSLKQDYGDLNKALKMAEKSAHIDAVLRMAGLSEVFTQDMEDMPQQPEEPHPLSPPIERISSEQRKCLEKRIKDLGLSVERVNAWLRRAWKTELPDLPASKFSALWTNLNKWSTEQDEARLERQAIQAE